MKKYTATLKNHVGVFVGALLMLGLGYYQLHNLTVGLAGFVKEEDDMPAVISSVEAYEYKSCPGKAVVDKATSFVPTHIEISASDINLPIVSVPLLKGTWQVNSGVANFAEGTSPVTFQGGNVGIFGHDRVNAFANIKKLKSGDLIIVTDAGHKATYKVQSTEVIKPEKVDVFYPTKEPTLTLITCDGLFSDHRYSVTAQLVSIEDTNCN